MQAGRAPFLGRDAESAVLDAALADVMRGEFRAVVVAGEAGIGKSRLVREFVARADARVLAVVGECADSGGGPIPFAAANGIFRGLRRAFTADPELAADGLAERLDALVPTTFSGSAEAWLDGVARLFESVGARRPLIVVIEDAHWADGSTLDAIRYVVTANRDAAMLLLVTYRSDDVGRLHPLRPLLAELDRARVVQRLPLAKLDADAVRSLAAALTGAAPEDPGVAGIVERGDGVPFFVEELAGSLGESLPDSLRDLLLLRYEPLGADAKRALRVLALGGLVVPHRLVAAAAATDDAALDAAMAEAVDAGIVTVDGDRYRFRHALLREAIIGELMPGETLRLHAAWADAIAAQAAPLSPASLAAIADHRWAAHDSAGALSAAIAAMRAAEAANAASTAARMGERALEAWSIVPDAEQVAGLDWHVLAVDTAHALDEVGRWDRGMEVIRSAIDAWPESDPSGAARAWALASTIALGVGDAEAEDAAIDAAIALVPPGVDDALRADLLARRDSRLRWRGRFREAVAALTEVIELARAAGSRDALARALSFRGDARGWLGDRGAIDDVEAAIETAAGLADRGLGVRATMFRGMVHFALGEWDAAVAVWRAQQTDPDATARTQLALGINIAEALYNLGRVAEAAEVYAGARRRMLPGTIDALQSEGMAIRLAYWAGEDVAARIEALLPEWRATRPNGASEYELALPRALVELDAGRRDAALAIAAAVVEAHLPEEPFEVLQLAWVAARAAGPDWWAAAEVRAPYERWLDYFEGLPSVAFIRALIAAETGAGTWDAVLAAGHGPGVLTLYARLRLGGALLAAGDRAAAREALVATIEGAAAGGVGRIAREAERLLADAGLQRVAPARGAEPATALSEREQQVLDLIAEGLTNAQIAARLFISVKTVSVHVSAVLRKLGVASRTEAAVRARGRVG